jgi:PmbA protein
MNRLLPDAATLSTLAEQTLALAKKAGADACEVDVDHSVALAVTARLGQTENIEYVKDRGLTLTVYVDGRKGHASCQEFSRATLEKLAEKAVSMARLSDADPCHGLAAAEKMAKNFINLDRYHPWRLTPEQALQQAIDCEQHALQYDKRLKNSEGAGVEWSESIGVYANSHGFLGAEEDSKHSLHVSVIAEEDGDMQTDYAYSVACAPEDLQSVAAVGVEAAQKAVAKLKPRKIKSQSLPVLFTPQQARGFWGSIIAALNGQAIYRRTSFLVDKLGEKILPDWLTLTEYPHLPRQLGSSAFDSEGVATYEQAIIAEGRVQTYLLNQYSACRLQMEVRGHASGVHNLCVPGQENFDSLLKKMGTGLLVTEQMGSGVNLLTGDYSRGASGFWVEGGEVQFPVAEITIAGRLQDLAQHLIATGNDLDYRGSIHCGSVLFENMTVAGE